MSWTKIEEAPSRQTAFGKYRKGTTRTTKALDVWRCSGCRSLACGPAGEEPGACMHAKCEIPKPKRR